MRLARVLTLTATLTASGCLQVPGYCVPGGYSSSYRRYVDHYDAHVLAPSVLPSAPLLVDASTAEVLPPHDPAAADAVDSDQTVHAPPAAAPMSYTRVQRRPDSARPTTRSFR